MTRLTVTSGLVAATSVALILGLNCIPQKNSDHELIFTVDIPEGYQGTSSCLECHADEADDMLASGHWNWEGDSVNIEGYETGTRVTRPGPTARPT